MRLNSLNFAFSTPTPLFYAVTRSAVLFHLQVKAVVPSARHLCCNVEHINVLKIQNCKH